MSSCPGAGASSTSETVKRLDSYILRAIPPRFSPDANSQIDRGHLKTLIEMGIVEMQDDEPALTHAGLDVII